MRKLLTAALAAATLSGCQSTQQAATPRSVVFAGVSNATIQQTTSNAQVHCDQYGRDAEMIPDDVADGRASFRCVDRNGAPSPASVN